MTSISSMFMPPFVTSPPSSVSLSSMLVPDVDNHGLIAQFDMAMTSMAAMHPLPRPTTATDLSSIDAQVNAAAEAFLTGFDDVCDASVLAHDINIPSSPSASIPSATSPPYAFTAVDTTLAPYDLVGIPSPASSTTFPIAASPNATFSTATSPNAAMPLSAAAAITASSVSGGSNGEETSPMPGFASFSPTMHPLTSPLFAHQMLPEDGVMASPMLQTSFPLAGFAMPVTTSSPMPSSVAAASMMSEFVLPRTSHFPAGPTVPDNNTTTKEHVLQAANALQRLQQQNMNARQSLGVGLANNGGGVGPVRGTVTPRLASATGPYNVPAPTPVSARVGAGGPSPALSPEQIAELAQLQREAEDRRAKNSAAARRSRQKRTQKVMDLEKRVMELERENMLLKRELELTRMESGSGNANSSAEAA